MVGNFSDICLEESGGHLITPTLLFPFDLWPEHSNTEVPGLTAGLAHVFAGKLRSHEVGSLSVEGSSRDSEDQSDLIIKRLGDGPELKQYLAPDVSGLAG